MEAFWLYKKKRRLPLTMQEWGADYAVSYALRFFSKGTTTVFIL